ncbi:MAG TPA: signal peptidase II [Acidimicrobiales bacterium]|nr:signal peptidase II [Acidimicrobiales bacterium]
MSGRARPPIAALIVPVAAAIVALDQLTKSLALDRLADGPVDVVWTLRFHLTFNSGLSFGQGKGLTPYITVLGVVLVAGLGWWSRRLTSAPSAVAVGLLLGGACGNLVDRLVRGHDGAVVDFIDLQWWPVFNLADVAVFCGAGLLILATLRDSEPQADPA